jgi:ribonuclease HI
MGGRCEGIILDFVGKPETSYVWGLLNSTNNQAEAYVIFQCLHIANESEIKSLIIIGDSSTFIKSILLKSTPPKSGLVSILAHSQKEVCNLH